ncbi:MAG: T9SS type A sorting domain-containing protein [candidate division Zixibacteria bacterium]|nr:T9SS type A sorting domain-containing protein [candidate division Zixibacteria bacterium]
MKRNFMFLLLVFLVLAFANSLWAQCPEDTIDLGECDTLHVVPWPETDTCFIGCNFFGCDTICINEPGEKFPCFLYVNLLVTHDSNTLWWEDEWAQDSIASMVVPLTWTRTNPTAYCSLSEYWNTDQLTKYELDFRRSLWRHFHPSELDSNRMTLIKEIAGWNMNVKIANDSSLVSGTMTPPHIFISAVPINAPYWWEGDRTLLATLTFRLEDTMTICIDTTFWPPESNFLFVRVDLGNYVPRSNMPDTIFIDAEGNVSDVRCIEDWTEEEGRPTTFLLSQNYPNPFNPVTNFKFTVPEASCVKIEIFNILGQKVKTLVDEDMRAGVFIVDWDGKDERGVEVSSGIYFYRMTAGDFSDTKRMVLLK